MTSLRKPSLLVRALGGHAALGLVVSGLLYLVALSGTLVVIHDRWQRWEQPRMPEMSRIDPAAVQSGMRAVLAREAGKPRTTHLYVRLPSPDLPRTIVTTDSGSWYMDAHGRIAGKSAPAWTDFLIGLHEYLHLPQTWGLVLVGALGAALMALAVTGILAHGHLVRDAFRLRTRHDPRIARADWHNRLGVWTLPFVLAIGATGAFIGLSGIGADVLARAYTGGDTIKVYASIFGNEPEPDATPAELPDLSAALKALARRVPETTPTYVIAHDPGTRGAFVQIIAEHPRRLIYGESYGFDRVGRWLGPAGLSDGPVGQQTAASAYRLHFGDYGGLAVELAYILFGLALCAMTATGTTLWLLKRQRRGMSGERLRAMWSVVVWGTPVAIVAMLWLRAIGGSDMPLGIVFWIALIVALVAAAFRPGWFVVVRLRILCWVGLLLTSVLHLVVLRPPQPGSIVIDVLVAGATLVALRAELLATEPAH